VLTGFKNRLSVLFNWTVAFLGRGPSERVITAQQVFGRHAIEAQAAVAGSTRAIDRGMTISANAVRR
jgi:hypothetical protein